MRIYPMLKTFLSTIGVLLGGASAGTLTVHISNVQSAKGVVKLALYPETSAGDFPHKGNIVFADPSTVIAPAKEGTVTIVVPIPDGTYAAAVMHDINANDKMDMLFALPKEPYGFSNDAKGILLPPSFKKASFLVNGDTTIGIRIDK